MGAITLPNFRVTADVTMNTKLKDGGVYIDWAGLTDIKAWLFSDVQRAIAGRCDVTIDGTDSTRLVCTYAATKPQYLGVQRLIVQAKYMGRTKTYDKPVFVFVRHTADQAGTQIVISDPEVDVELEVTDVSSSILENILAACIKAAEDAEHAAHLVPLQVLLDCEAATAVALTAATHAPTIGENGNWWVWNATLEAYEDTGNEAQGPTGNGIASWSVVESQEDAGSNVVTITFTDGTSETFTYKNGHTGNGIASIVQTVESPDDAGTNVITITMTNGTVVTFNVKNGSKGQPGAAQAAYKSVETLPTASAATMDKIYLTPSGTSGVYNMSYTDYDGSAYSWVSLGTTAIQLSDYATKAEVSQLEAEVDGKVDRELNTDKLCIIDSNGYVIAEIDVNGVNAYDVRVKIDGNLVSVKSLLATLNTSIGGLQGDIETLGGRITTEKNRAETEEAKKLDREIEDDAFRIVDPLGYIVAEIDVNGVNAYDVRVKIDGNLVSVKSLLAGIRESVEGKLDKEIEDDAIVIVDGNGYIIARIDASGIHSAQDKHAVACMVLGEYYYPTAAPTRDSAGNVTHAVVMFGTGVAGSLDITYTNNNATQVVAHYGNYTYTITIARDSSGNVVSVSVN